MVNDIFLSDFVRLNRLENVYFKNEPKPASFCLCSVFSIKHYSFLQQIYVKKCPFSIWRWDTNWQPSDYESPPLTTRPGLPPQEI